MKKCIFKMLNIIAAVIFVDGNNIKPGFDIQVVLYNVFIYSLYQQLNLPALYKFLPATYRITGRWCSEGR